jgi:hypothetical protein
MSSPKRSPNPLPSEDKPPIPGAPPIDVADIARFQAYLGALPGKTCEAGKNCEHGAVWHIDQHGCDQVLLCDDHKRMWFWELNDGISNGWCICPECKGEFTAIKDIVTERPV